MLGAKDPEMLLDTAGSYSMTVTTVAVPEGYCVVSDTVDPLYKLVIVVVE